MNTFEKKYVIKNHLRNFVNFEKATDIVSSYSKDMIDNTYDLLKTSA